METIISAIISAGAAILVCAISNNKTITLIDYRLEQLEKKVDLHNNAVERLYKVEKQLGIDEQKIKTNEENIEDLKQYHK